MKSIVIDNGSGTIKAGFAGIDTPKLSIPAYVATPKHEKTMLGGNGELEGDFFVGQQAVDHRGIMKLSYPMTHGVVKNWEDMQRIWEYVFKELEVEESSSNPVLLTEAPRNHLENRGKTASIFFETFSSPALYFQVSAILSLYASGRVTGTILDSGDGVTSAVPVYEGFAVPSAIQRIDVAGRDVTDYLQVLLGKAGEYFSTTAEKETVKDIKEKICYIVPNLEQAESDAKEDDEAGIPYRLPDGNCVYVGVEKFQAPELLFNPSIIGTEQPGIHEILFKAIKKSDTDLRKILLSNIILAGGSTMFGGLGNRLYSEVKRLSKGDAKIKIYSPKRRLTSTWIGGSILAQLSTFKKMWVSRKEFEEAGTAAIYRRCF